MCHLCCAKLERIAGFILSIDAPSSGRQKHTGHVVLATMDSMNMSRMLLWVPSKLSSTWGFRQDFHFRLHTATRMMSADSKRSLGWL